MKYIAIIYLFLLSIPGVSCDCKEIKNLAEAQKLEYKESDLVFIGEVISSDPHKGEYKLKIIELFKGNQNEKIVTGKSVGYCSRFPRKEDGLWLAYARISPDGSIFIPDCGLSRNFRFPYAYNDEIRIFPPPPPPMKDFAMDELNWELKVTEYRQKALLVLKKEIEQLRKWK